MALRIIGGNAKGRALSSPTGLRTRPTSNMVRSAIFSMLEPYLDGARVLDLFSGTGALGVEALSRGAEWVDFLERDARQCAAINGTLHALDYADCGRVHRTQAERAPELLEGPYQVILMDPPYSYKKLATLLERLGETVGCRIPMGAWGKHAGECRAKCRRNRGQTWAPRGLSTARGHVRAGYVRLILRPRARPRLSLRASWGCLCPRPK